MQSIVIKEYDRFRQLGAMRSFDWDNGNLRWHKPEFAFKFLVVDSWLVIAPINDHITLYAVYSVRDMPIDEAKRVIKAIIDEQWSRGNPRVLGAGVISADGRVTGWKSEGFRIETPQGMREGIEQEVARLFQDGGLAIEPQTGRTP